MFEEWRSDQLSQMYTYFYAGNKENLFFIKCMKNFVQQELEKLTKDEEQAVSTGKLGP